MKPWSVKSCDTPPPFLCRENKLQDLDAIDFSCSRSRKFTGKEELIKADDTSLPLGSRRISEVNEHTKTNSPRDRRVSEATVLISSVSD